MEQDYPSSLYKLSVRREYGTDRNKQTKELLDKLLDSISCERTMGVKRNNACIFCLRFDHSGRILASTTGL